MDIKIISMRVAELVSALLA